MYFRLCSLQLARLFINFNRFTYSSTDNVETPGIRPSGDSISNIPQVLEGWHHRSLSAQADSVKDTDVFPRHRKPATEGVGGLGNHHRARSFIEKPDGSITALSK